MVDIPPSPCASSHPGAAAQQSPSPKKPSQKRASYLLSVKKFILNKVKKLIEDHHYSIHTACDKVGICHSLVSR